MKRSRSAPIQRKRTEVHERGFTLLEVLIASAIGSVVIFALYMSFSSVLAGRSSLDEQAERSREVARFVYAFTNEVQSAYLSSGNKATIFKGELTNGALPSGQIEFTAIVYPAAGAGGDLAAIRYSIDKSEAGLSSLYKEVWNPYETGREHVKIEVIEDVKGFDLSFYSKGSWSAAWDGRLENRTPEAVRAVVRIMDKGAEREVKALARAMIR